MAVSGIGAECFGVGFHAERVRGEPPVVLQAFERFDRERAWFPEVSWDGQWITYQVLRGDNSQIAVMDRNGGQQEVLTSDPGKHFVHSFASDNRRLAWYQAPCDIVFVEKLPLTATGKIIRRELREQ